MKALSFSEAEALRQDEPTDPRFISKVGNSYGMLKVLFYSGKIKSRHTFVCECDCGKFCVKYTSHLNSKAVSCGCLFTANAKDGRLAETRRTNVEIAIEKVERNTGCLVICETKGHTESTWNLLCKEHGVWSSRLRLLLQGSAQCPYCRNKSGYDKNFPATFYVFSVKDGDYPIGIKFGITNKQIEQRKKQLEFYSSGVQLDCIFSFYSEDGNFILNLERYVKENFRTRYLSKAVLGSGFTETLSYETKEQLLSSLHRKTEGAQTKINGDN